MKIRLAKELMSHDGTICISIDVNEVSYLSVLMDEIFGPEQLCFLATVKRGSATGHKAINQGIVNVTEYVVAYAKSKLAWKPNRVLRKRPRNERYSSYIVNRSSNPSDWQFTSLLAAFSEHVGIEKKLLRKELGNSYEKALYDFVMENADSVVTFARPDANKVSKETKAAIVQSKANPEKTLHVQRKAEADIYLRKGERIVFYRDRLAMVD